MTENRIRTIALLAAALALAGCAPPDGSSSSGRAGEYARGGNVVETGSYATERGPDTYLDIQEFRPRGDPRYLCVHAFRKDGGSLDCFLSER